MFRRVVVHVLGGNKLYSLFFQLSLGSFKGIPTDKILSHTPFLRPPSHSHLLLAPFFARSLTFVPRSLLRNPRKRLLRRLLTGATDGLLSITRGGSWIPFFLKEIKV